MLRRASRAALACAMITASVGCGGSTPTEPSTPADVGVGQPAAAGEPTPPVPETPRTRDALDRAVRLVNARAGAIVHVAAWRGHPLAGQILEAMPLRGPLERSGIDPMNDVDRVLIASADPRQRSAVAVYEHHVDAARLDRLLLEAMRDSSPPGEALREGSMTGARVNVPVSARGRQTTLSGDIWLATPTLLVVVPPRMPGAATFQQSAGLPMPSRNEGGSGWTEQPAEVFRNSRVDIPSTLSRADAWTFPQPGGGVRAEVRARSTSHDQALSDANALTGNLDRATRVKVGPLTVRVFQTPQFRAEGDEVVGEIDVSRGQLEQVLSMAEREADRY
jgi:hypothetical protein